MKWWVLLALALVVGAQLGAIIDAGTDTVIALGASAIAVAVLSLHDRG